MLFASVCLVPVASERASDLLEQELQEAVSHCVGAGIKPGSSALQSEPLTTEPTLQPSNIDILTNVFIL